MKDERVVMIDINLTRGLVTLLALALLAAAFLSYLAWGRDEAAASGSQIPLAASSGMRQYYLTTSIHIGADADGTDGDGAGVCASGYHFASLWEIMDPSNLKYNTILGETRADSGQGPPGGPWGGWVRTGYYSWTSSPPGKANCANWTSSNSGDRGTRVYLSSDWTTADAEFHVWLTDDVTCNTVSRVWCVADSVGTSVYLPLILKNRP